MRIAIFSLILLCVVKCQISDELSKLATGYFAGLEFADPVKALACVPDRVWALWLQAASDLATVSNWHDVSELLIGFTYVIRPFVETLRVSEACCEEGGRMYRAAAKVVGSRSDLVLAVTSNLDVVGPALKDVKTFWEAKDYARIGRVSGMLVKWVFNL